MRQLTANTIIRVRISRLSLTEDRRIYKPGEISEKTGKQKQPDGSWKKPGENHKAKNLKSESNSTSKGTTAELTEEQHAQTKAVETRINKAGWFKNPSSLKGMHPEAAKNIEKQCERIFKEFPQLKGFVEGLKVADFPKNNDKIYAMCQGTKKSAFIVFNKSFYSNKEKLNQSYAEQVEQNYHPAGTDSDSLIIHEMAHCICDYVAQKRGQDMFDFCRDLVQYVKETFEQNDIVFNIKEELGRYCTDINACPDIDTQDAELIAEAYAEFKCSKKPRRLANFIGNLLEGELE